MFYKFKVLPIEEAYDCPFYLMDAKGNHRCLIKQISTPMILSSLMADEVQQQTDWVADCQGQWENCSVLPLLYDMQDEEAENAGEEEISDYDPYDDEDYSDEEGLEETEKQEVERPIDNNQIVDEAPGVIVSIEQVDNPYNFDVNALIYPANNALVIDDDLLVTMTFGRIQEYCNILPRPIKMGNVYPTFAGGEVKPKRIYHAVVAGSSRLGNEQDVRSAMLKALDLAETERARTVAVLPFDCVTLDIDKVVLIQLSAIKNFIDVRPLKYLQEIFVITEHEEVLQSLENYYERIFGYPCAGE